MLYNWNVGSACSFLSVDTLLPFFFFFCFFFPFCFPASSFTHQISMDPAQLATSLFTGCFPFTPELVSVWIHLFVVKSSPSTCSFSVLNTSRHHLSRILPRTHHSSKYCISVSENHGILLSGHLTTFVSSCL